MSAGGGNSGRFRDTVVERILISRWTGWLAVAVLGAVQLLSAFGPVLAELAATMYELRIIDGVSRGWATSSEAPPGWDWAL
ncbi:hypothetical protein [Streptomonospora litoralis]|uniref:Uncharacterized protein n=1 Tax=Streptomonospora litoralis TaxID=2498135 RepID=A0A4P6Q7J0_9ACTN|nr:hypothetical protein [Streptomonospora litoralis]QBI56695.1 hypothetical protein EKD16_24765 [Streptomonospora litoralis]